MCEHWPGQRRTRGPHGQPSLHLLLPTCSSLSSLASAEARLSRALRQSQAWWLPLAAAVGEPGCWQQQAPQLPGGGRAGAAACTAPPPSTASLAASSRQPSPAQSPAQQGVGACKLSVAVPEAAEKERGHGLAAVGLHGGSGGGTCAAVSAAAWLPLPPAGALLGARLLGPASPMAFSLRYGQRAMPNLRHSFCGCREQRGGGGSHG